MTGEPSGLLVFAVLFGLILGCLALMGLVATVQQHGIGGIARRLASLASALVPSQTPTESPPRRMRRVPIRHRSGRLAGSRTVPVGGTTAADRSNDAEPRSTDGTASERRGTTVPLVPQNDEIVLTVPEMLLITTKLAQGIAPSDIAKALPGYRGEKYKQYMEKVARTQATLAEVGATPSVEAGQVKSA